MASFLQKLQQSRWCRTGQLLRTKALVIAVCKTEGIPLSCLDDLIDEIDLKVSQIDQQYYAERENECFRKSAELASQTEDRIPF